MCYLQRRSAGDPTKRRSSLAYNKKKPSKFHHDEDWESGEQRSILQKTWCIAQTLGTTLAQRPQLGKIGIRKSGEARSPCGQEPHAPPRARPRNLPKHQERRTLGPFPEARARCVASAWRLNTSLLLCAMGHLWRMVRAPIGSQVQGAARVREWTCLAKPTHLRTDTEPLSAAPITRSFHELQCSSGQDSALDVDPSCQHQARLRSKTKRLC